MTLDDINNLDFSEMGIWPLPIKIGFISILCIILAVGWYFNDIKDQEALYKTEINKEKELRKSFTSKQERVSNLMRYRQQLKDMEVAFSAMLTQLPDKSEIPDLLVDISEIGLTAGMEFSRIQAANERKQEFYTEIPINLQVFGDYHQIGEFISGLATLPRIMTIHDIQISKSNAQNKGPLVMKATAKTYRYTGENIDKDKRK